MNKLIRFGVSIDNELLKKFDKLIAHRGYSNRSEAIRDLIRDDLVQQEWQSSNVDSIGTITIIYDHHVRELTELLNSVQHNYINEILATTHIHIDHNNCLEIIAVKGKTNKIREIADKLISLRGVKHGKLVTTTTGEYIT